MEAWKKSKWTAIRWLDFSFSERQIGWKDVVLVLGWIVTSNLLWYEKMWTDDIHIYIFTYIYIFNLFQYVCHGVAFLSPEVTGERHRGERGRKAYWWREASKIRGKGTFAGAGTHSEHVIRSTTHVCSLRMDHLQVNIAPQALYVLCAWNTCFPGLQCPTRHSA